MEMKDISRHKTLWKMNPTSEPLFVTGAEVNSLKKFTIPKIKRTTEKVYLSPCYTNTREYSFIRDTLNQSRLDTSCDLQLSWQFGDTKLVHNKDLEKKFTSKRSEMRENGRHARELEEHFCFLALSQSNVAEIYKNGLSTKASHLKILGNPLLGVYVFRHVDVALNYAHSRSFTVENIMIFKVLFGKVKKIQPSLDKNKICLDPSPNFDCHMSRNIPSLRDTIELQAHGSAVYVYEYSILSRPVDKPRQCLPYAVVTVKFIGHKDNGHFMTSLRFLSTGFPKRAERMSSLNNCTVAKRIGKGKDATVIFEHFRKPVHAFAQDDCSCSTPNSEIKPSNSNIPDSFGNIQNRSNSVLDTHNGWMEYRLTDCKDSSQVYACDSGISVTPSDNKESVNGGLLSLTQLRNILRGLSAAMPLQSNVNSSTVTTSKLIKDPRLTRREENLGKHNVTNTSETFPFEKSSNLENSNISLASVPSDSASSSEAMPSDHDVFTNCLDTPCFKFSFDTSRSQAQDMYSKNHDSTTRSKITMTWQDKNPFPICSSSISSEVEDQNHDKEKAQRSQQRSCIPFLNDQDSDPCNESVNTFTQGNEDPIPQGSQFSHLQTDKQASTVFPLQMKESVCEYLQRSGETKNFASPEDNFNHGEKQNLWKTKISPADNYILLHQECKENMSLDSLREICDHVLMTQNLEIPKSPISTTMNNYEVNHLALEFQNNLSPGVESISQKHLHHPSLCEDGIRTSSAVPQKLMELKLEKPNQNCVSVTSDALQETKDIYQANKLPFDQFISLHDAKRAHDNLDYNIAQEHPWIHRKNENKPASLETIQRACQEIPQLDSRDHDQTLFCHAQLNNKVHMNIDFEEQRDQEKQKEAKEESALPPENNIKCVYEAEKQGFHTNNNSINSKDKKRENKNYSHVGTLNSKEPSATFSLTWKTKVSTETTASGSEYTISAVGQKDTQNAERNAGLLSSMLPKIAGSLGHVAASAAELFADTRLPASHTNPEDHQGHKLKEASRSPDLDLFIKHKASDYKLHVDKNKLQNAFCQSISDNDLVFDNFEVENEIELGLEQCDDEFLFHQDIPSHGNVPYEDFEDSYEILKSRIDWKGLFGSKTEEREVSENRPREENSDHFYYEQSDCFDSSPQKNQEETCDPILLPDLHVKIANVFMPGFGPTLNNKFKPLTLNNNFCRYVTGATKTKINEENRKGSGLDIHSPCSGGNSGNACEQEYGNIIYASELVSKSEISHSFDLNHKRHMSHMSEHQNNVPWVTEASSVTAINNKGTCSSTKPKTDNTRNKKDTDSRLSKRKLRVSSEDQHIIEKDLRYEICRKKRKPNSHDSSECFSSLSQGRIKTFSQSEKHIRSVLNILNSEVSLCKSKRLSRKLDRAVVHLKKAHRRVHTSLQLIAKVGEARKSPLPKSYAIICNNFWESCDLLGYNPMPERRYYSTKHFLSKRKYDKPAEREALGFENYNSLTHVSKSKTSQRREERIRKCLSGNTVTSSISRNRTTIHVRGFCDQEYPESQLTLCSTSQTTAQSAYNCRNPRTLRSSAFQSIPEKNESLFSSVCPDENLTEKGNPPNIKFLSNFSKNEHLENNFTHDSKDVTKENSPKASEVINDSESSSCLKVRPMCLSTDKDFDAICIAHTKLKTDVFISVLESNMEHFLNMCKADNLILTDFQRNLKVNFPIKKWSRPVESLEPSITTANFLMDPLSLTLLTSKKHNNIPQSVNTAVTDSDRKSLQTYLDKQGNFAVDSFAPSTIEPAYLRGDSKKEFLKTKLSSLSNCICLNYNKTNVTENCKLECTLVTKESKSCGGNIISNERSLFLKNNIKDCVSKNCIAKKDIQDIKMCKFKQTEEAKGSVHRKSMMDLSPAQTGNKDQKRNILEEFSSTREKITKNNLMAFSLSTEKISDAVSLNSTVSNQLNQRDKVEEIRVSNNSESSLHSETVSSSKPDIRGMNHMADSHATSESSEVTILQKKNISHVNELKEKQSSADCSTLISSLTQILRRADEASSLQILQEQTKICQNILPPFVEAFERMQECSLEQVLISRELLEQKQWNNCKRTLKPCAVDSLAELQMMMETIQFIENKKRLLQGEPTFRSLLWYDETLYSELLGRPRGFQQQSSFYPAFQGRLKYNAFCELQNYHHQLLDLFEETKRENKSYYTLLKYKRQIEECEAIMKHCSDCFDFCLSVPFTCGVNFGDNLGDLETLRKSTLKVISSYRKETPKNDAYPEKQDHLWIIIEMVSSKINFIKSNEAEGIKVSLYGLEHIFFDAAKSLAWKEKKKIFSKIYSGKRKREMLLKMNQNSFSKLQKLYDTLSKDLNSEQISNNDFEESTMITSRKPDNLINKATISAGNYTLNSTVLPHLDICHISEIIDQAEFADLKKLRELILRCTEHLDILKKYFQMQQEDNIDDVFITEENVLDMLKNQKHGAVILKPEAIETYIEIVMLSETVHFLKNSMAKKQDKQRFRSMLWFDLSLVPELIVCQEKMTAFSFLKENATECLEKVIETTISALNKELDIILNYNNAVNSSYALRLYARELEELEEIKKLLKKSLYSVPLYINFVPYIASINYGNTMTELEYNYNQFSSLLKNVMTAHRKDLGKIAHITKVMKTIEHMKLICAKNDTLTISFILCQMIRNRRKTLQHTKKEKPYIPIKLDKSIDKPSTCMMVPSISECIVKNIPNSSKKRPLPADKCEDSREQERNAAVSSCKKQKIGIEDVLKISKEKTTLELPRAVRSHLRDENEAGPSSSDDLRRDLMSPKKAETQRSLPNSHSQLGRAKGSCPPKSGVNTDAAVGASEALTGQEGDHRKETDVNLGAAGVKNAKRDHSAFTVCDQNCVDGTFSIDHKTTSRKISKNSPGSAEQPSPSDTRSGAGPPRVPAASVLSKPVFRFVRDIHANFEIDEAVCELPDSELMHSSVKNSSCSPSPETVFIQSTNPVLQINETQQRETEPKAQSPGDTSNPSARPLRASGSGALNGNRSSECSLSRPGANDNPKVPTRDATPSWSDPPPSSRPLAYHSSESSLAVSYPYYTWCVYHYSSVSGHSITHTYQGVTAYDVQPSPVVLDTVVGIQSTRADLSYSQYFSYVPGEPHASDFVPVTGYFRSQMPVYHFQQPAFTQYQFHQPLPQASYSYLPNSGVLPEVPRAYASWQQESFQPGH